MNSCNNATTIYQQLLSEVLIKTTMNKFMPGYDILSTSLLVVFVGLSIQLRCFIFSYSMLFYNFFYINVRKFIPWDLSSWSFSAIISIFIEEKDEAYRAIDQFLAMNSSSTSVRNWNVKLMRQGMPTLPKGSSLESMLRGKTEKPKLFYTPGFGEHSFMYKSRRIYIRRVRDVAPCSPNNVSFAQSNTTNDQIQLWTYDWNSQFLKNFLDDIVSEWYERNFDKMPIFQYRPFDQLWTPTCTKIPRKLETVILKEGQKEYLLEDVNYFRSSRNWYNQRGIPYRRGYLLYGPPGTGKTSFIEALAHDLSMPLCIVNLSASQPPLNDTSLHQLMNAAPANSILLMEDVDVAVAPKENGRGITLSGLLNALDGIMAQEGSVVFLTTNYVERLSPSLIRPGRIDIKVKFDNADAYQIENMFLKFYQPKDHPDTDNSNLQSNLLKEAICKKGSDEEIKKYAKKVVEYIPSGQVTPAELQSYFTKHRDSSIEELLEGINNFLSEINDDRQRYIEEAVSKGITKLLNTIQCETAKQPNGLDKNKRSVHQTNDLEKNKQTCQQIQDHGE